MQRMRFLVIFWILAGPATAGAGKTMKVGLFVPVTGDLAARGAEVTNGLALALGPEGRGGGEILYQLVVRDDAGRPEMVPAAVAELVAEGCTVLVGGLTSDLARAAIPGCTAKKVILITPTATDPRLTSLGSWVFRVPYVDPLQARSMARFGATALGARTAAVVTLAGAAKDRELAGYFTTEWMVQGGQVVHQALNVAPGDTTGGWIRILVARKPEVLYLPGDAAKVVPLVKALKAAKVEGTFLGSVGLNDPALLGEMGAPVRGAYFPDHFHPDADRPGLQDFLIAYKDAHLADPSGLAALAFDAGNWIRWAREEAGTETAADLAPVLSSTEDFPGITGALTVGASRDPWKPIPVVTLLDGGVDLAAVVEVPDPKPAPAKASAARPRKSPWKRVLVQRGGRGAPVARAPGAGFQWAAPNWTGQRDWVGSIPIFDRELDEDWKQNAITKRAVKIVQQGVPSATQTLGQLLGLGIYQSDPFYVVLDQNPSNNSAWVSAKPDGVRMTIALPNWGLGTSDRNLRGTVLHEMTHAMMMVRMGPVAFQTLPRWFTEGIAVFMDGSGPSKLQSARRLHGGDIDPILDGLDVHPADSLRIEDYAEAWLTLVFLAERWGRPRLDDFFRSLIHQRAEFAAAVNAQYGIGLADLQRLAQEHAKFNHQRIGK